MKGNHSVATPFCPQSTSTVSLALEESNRARSELLLREREARLRESEGRFSTGTMRLYVGCDFALERWKLCRGERCLWMGRPPKGEKNRLKLKRVTYRLPQELVELLAQAAPQKNLNLSEYVELALKDRFKEDGIK
jgi:hypothetical protein